MERKKLTDLLPAREAWYDTVPAMKKAYEIPRVISVIEVVKPVKPVAPRTVTYELINRQMPVQTDFKRYHRDELATTFPYKRKGFQRRFQK